MTVVSYVDRRDTLNRLGRINVTGMTAAGWLDVLDPLIVRAISDQDLARLVGGIVGSPTYPGNGLIYPYPGLYPNGPVTVPPVVVGTAGAFGAGPFGSGPFGGALTGQGPTPPPPLSDAYSAAYGGTY